ncbi:MAG: ATP-binding protein [Akkermansiaceae bacterium]
MPGIRVVIRDALANMVSMQLLRVLRRSLWIFLVLAFGASCPASERPRVLILFSNDRLLPASLELENGLRRAIMDESGKNPSMDLFGEFLDAVRFPDAALGVGMERFLIERHQSRPPAVVVSVGQQALEFLMERRESLFPHVPLVFCGVTQPQVAGLHLGDNVAGRTMDWSIVPLLQSLPTMRPRIRKVLLVAGAAEFDRQRHEEALAQVEPFKARYQFESSLGESLDKLQERVAALKDDTLVFYLCYFMTPDGRSMTPLKVAGELANASRVPVVCVYDTYIGSGVLGGPVMPFEDEGFAMGEMVHRVLAAGNADEVGILPAGKPKLVFDGRVLDRYGWKRDAIPSGSEIRFEKASLWESHRNSVLLGTGTLLLQSGLIIGLIVSRGRRQAAEKERQHSESRFIGVFRGSPVSISIIRQSDSRVIDVNPAWERTMQLTRDEAIGRTHHEIGFVFEVVSDEVFLDYLSAGEPLHGFEQRIKMPNGKSRLLSITTELLNLRGEACYVSMAQDITDRQEAEEARQQLAHASRLGMLGELTASIAHEVNQPLGAILSNADAATMLMESETPPLNEIREILLDIRRDNQRASEVIRQVRSMVARTEFRRLTLDPGELASGVAGLVRHDCKRRAIVITCQTADQLPKICGEKAQLEQVLLNLLLNAMDAVKDMDPAKRAISIRVDVTASGQVRISVADSGSGIAPELLPRVFDNFFTTKEDGMGLGLALSRSIAEAHRGQLIAENAPEGGAVFHFILPPSDDP